MYRFERLSHIPRNRCSGLTDSTHLAFWQTGQWKKFSTARCSSQPWAGRWMRPGLVERHRRLLVMTTGIGFRKVADCLRFSWWWRCCWRVPPIRPRNRRLRPSELILRRAAAWTSFENGEDLSLNSCSRLYCRCNCMLEEVVLRISWFSDEFSRVLCLWIPLIGRTSKERICFSADYCLSIPNIGTSV